MADYDPTRLSGADLVLTIDSQDYSCLVSVASFTMPGPGAGTSVKMGCAGKRRTQKGEWENGEISGTVDADTTDTTGLTTKLAALRASGDEVSYSITFYPNAAGNNLHFSGEATVPTLELPWEEANDPATHPITLSLLTATVTSPMP